MEFWGVEVKSGEPLSVQPGDGMVLHLSQACIGEMKKEKGSETVCLFMNVDGKKLVLGTLFSDKLPQQQFDLVFDRDFELSHNWKNGSVFFYGYRAANPFDESDGGDEFESDSEDETPAPAAINGKPATEIKHEKPTPPEKSVVTKPAVGKQKVKIVEPSKDVKTEEDDSDDDSDDEMFLDESSDEDGQSDSESENEDGSDDEDEETPKKVQTSNKKRPVESATKTPGPDKKAKTVTPQKTDGKKGGGHVATPHPAKQAGKTPANKSNQKTPKSGGSFSCKSCDRAFNSEQGLDSHTKAKHSSGK